MRLIQETVFDAYTTQGALRRMRRIRQGVLGGARTHDKTTARRFTEWQRR